MSYITNTIISFALLISTPILASNVHNNLKSIEKKYHRTIGISALNTATNEVIEYRANERFPLQSTFKLFLAAKVLQQTTETPEVLNETIHYQTKDLISWSPVTQNHIQKGMSVRELCQAAVSESDNTAANLLLKRFANPKAITSFAHSLGGKTYHIDGWEPHLNSNPKIDKDTATPHEVRQMIYQLTMSNHLDNNAKKQLIEWMQQNKTGGKRIRAALPNSQWRVADKTGSGNYGVSNDIGIIWPPNANPIFIAIYTHAENKQDDNMDMVISDATKEVLKSFKLA